MKASSPQESDLKAIHGIVDKGHEHRQHFCKKCMRVVPVRDQEDRTRLDVDLSGGSHHYGTLIGRALAHPTVKVCTICGCLAVPYTLESLTKILQEQDELVVAAVDVSRTNLRLAEENVRLSRENATLRNANRYLDIETGEIITTDRTQPVHARVSVPGVLGVNQLIIPGSLPAYRSDNNRRLYQMTRDGMREMVQQIPRDRGNRGSREDVAQLQARVEELEGLLEKQGLTVPPQSQAKRSIKF